MQEDGLGRPHHVRAAVVLRPRREADGQGHDGAGQGEADGAQGAAYVVPVHGCLRQVRWHHPRPIIEQEWRHIGPLAILENVWPGLHDINQRGVVPIRVRRVRVLDHVEKHKQRRSGVPVARALLEHDPSRHAVEPGFQHFLEVQWPVEAWLSPAILFRRRTGSQAKRHGDVVNEGADCPPLGVKEGVADERRAVVVRIVLVPGQLRCDVLDVARVVELRPRQLERVLGRRPRLPPHHVDHGRAPGREVERRVPLVPSPHGPLD
mmetsp:Transcript_32815/g.40312  ORF Transcript_32815/g.40312 Transcript_32815/m.40312 type:complete len:264 (+) Transcript_32815:783-1574(+)